MENHDAMLYKYAKNSLKRFYLAMADRWTMSDSIYDTELMAREREAVREYLAVYGKHPEQNFANIYSVMEFVNKYEREHK